MKVILEDYETLVIIIDEVEYYLKHENIGFELYKKTEDYFKLLLKEEGGLD